jgi:hypothetical protein
MRAPFAGDGRPALVIGEADARGPRPIFVDGGAAMAREREPAIHWVHSVGSPEPILEISHPSLSLSLELDGGHGTPAPRVSMDLEEPLLIAQSFGSVELSRSLIPGYRRFIRDSRLQARPVERIVALPDPKNAARSSPPQEPFEAEVLPDGLAVESDADSLRNQSADDAVVSLHSESPADGLAPILEEGSPDVPSRSYDDSESAMRHTVAVQSDSPVSGTRNFSVTASHAPHLSALPSEPSRNAPAELAAQPTPPFVPVISLCPMTELDIEALDVPTPQARPKRDCPPPLRQPALAVSPASPDAIRVAPRSKSREVTTPLASPRGDISPRIMSQPRRQLTNLLQRFQQSPPVLEVDERSSLAVDTGGGPSQSLIVGRRSAAAALSRSTAHRSALITGVRWL